MLCQEYEKLRCVKTKGVVAPLEILQYEGGMALVYENLSNPSLASVLGQKPMDISGFLNVSIRLAEILGSLHQHGIVHRNLKPTNIFMGAKWDQCLITDMGMLPPGLLGQGTIDFPGVIDSVLPYIAPEQTGRINRRVDNRTGLSAHQHKPSWPRNPAKRLQAGACNLHRGGKSCIFKCQVR
jgi:serine/threonine protein kinase